MTVKTTSEALHWLDGQNNPIFSYYRSKQTGKSHFLKWKQQKKDSFLLLMMIWDPHLVQCEFIQNHADVKPLAKHESNKEDERSWMCNDLTVVPYSSSSSINNNRWPVDGDRRRKKNGHKLINMGVLCVYVCGYDVYLLWDSNVCNWYSHSHPSPKSTVITRRPLKDTHTHTTVCGLLYPFSTSFFDSQSTHWSIEGLSVTVPTDLRSTFWNGWGQMLMEKVMQFIPPVNFILPR